MWETLLLTVTVVVLGTLVFLVKQFSPPPDVPGAPPRVETMIPLIGPAIAFGRDPIGTLKWARDKYGTVFRLNLLLFDATFLLSDACEGGGDDDVNFQRYFNAKETQLNFAQGVEKFMRPIFSIPDQSLMPKEQLDACHGSLRNGLSAKYMPFYATNAAQIAEKTFDEWCSRGSFDLGAALSDLVASINVRNFIGKQAYAKHCREFAECMLSLEQNGTSPTALMLPWLPLPAISKCRKARATLSTILKDEIVSRQSSKQEHEDDFIQQLIDKMSQLEGKEFPMPLALDTMIAVFFGAHHNTANTLTWLIALLHEKKRSQRDAYNRAMEEQKVVLVDVVPKFSEDIYQKLDSLKYLEQCVQEVSRLYFTVMLPPRKVIEPFRVETVTIPSGSYLCISPIVAHTDGNIFPDSTHFFPARFDPKHGKNPYGMAYVQFGYGRHRCTGEKYALTVIKTVMSLLLTQYDVELSAPVPLPLFHKPIGTATPATPILVRVSRKSAPFAARRE